MKILQIFDFFSPLHGGGTIILMDKLTRALSRRGHEVVIYTSDFELDQEYLNSFPEVKIYPFHCISSAAHFYFIPQMISVTRERLRQFDIVHLHTLRSFQNIVIHHYARKYGVPYVVDAHGSAPRTAGGKSCLKWLFDLIFGQKILKDAARVIAETKVGIQEYRQLGIKKEEKIILISPPFSVEEFDKLPPIGQFRKNHKFPEKHIVSFLGRIHQIKGLDFLVEAFAEAARQMPDIILVIIGPDDGFKSVLDKMIKQLNLEGKVLFTGFLSGQEKLAALVDSDIVIQTSRYEQGAWAPIEAILCGTPIIVTAHTGAGEDVKKLDAGYLVDFGDTKGLAKLITEIINDPTEAKAKAMKAAQYIRQNESMAKKIVEYEQVYAKCIEEAKQQGQRHRFPKKTKGD